MTTTSNKNWTEEQMAAIAAIAEGNGTSKEYPKGYLTNEDVVQACTRPVFADKSDNMLRSKAVALGMYRRQEQRARPQDGSSSVRKPQIIEALERLLGFEDEALISLVKCNKDQLGNIVARLATLSQQDASEDAINQLQPLVSAAV